MNREIGAGLVAVVMLSGCDQAARAENAALRAEMAAQSALVTAQAAQLRELEATLAALEKERAALEEERAALARSAARQEAAAAPTPEPVLTPSCVDNHCVIQRAELDALLAAPARMGRLARVIPNVTDGATTGIKLFAIRGGSPLALLGFKNGDVVRSVGGLALDGIDAMMTAYTTVLKRGRWEVEGLRAGQPFKISIELR